MKIENGVLININKSDIINETVVIPNGVTKIGSDAFKEWKSLREIHIPNGVTQIGKAAFEYCPNLTKINIPDSVTEIGDRAFNGCRSLEEIHIPNGVTKIGYKTFCECESLTKIQLSDGVTEIDNNAFEWCADLIEINIPDSVTKIGDSAFNGCENLTEMYIPDGVTRIDCKVFCGCGSLIKIHLPDGVTEIGANAFELCQSLVEINLPDSVAKIGNSAFEWCDSLVEIDIPDGVTQINNSTFAGCESLTKVHLPDSVIQIDDFAFDGCSKLPQIYIPNNVTQIGDRAFLDCDSLTKVHLPDGVTKIDILAFYRCSGLEEINIPDSVVEIGEDAFKNCENLNNIIISDKALDKHLEFCIKMRIPMQKIFKDYYDKIEQIKAKAHFKLSSSNNEYNEDDMNILYYKMLHSIGIEEIEKIVEIPNLTSKEIENYSLEKDEAFNILYDTKYEISGDFKIVLEILKKLDLSQQKIESNEKNTVEMRLFKSINQKLEEGYEGTLADLISICVQEQNLEIEENWLEEISSFEKSINKAQINKILHEMNGKIGQALGESTNEYPEAIVEMQIRPIEAMVEDIIRNTYRDNGKIDLETLKADLERKIEGAHAPYIVQHKNQIVKLVLKFLEKDETFQEGINHSLVTALRKTKENIGDKWKYKLNQTLKQMGYSFSSLPKCFSAEEIDKLSDLIGREQIKAKPVSILKEGADRESAYKLLLEKDLPKIVTYKQLHDMFFSVHEPYSEEFKKYFKEHREEFWENPEYYGQFGRIHNNFTEIIKNPKLKNIYKKGELSVGKIVEYFKEMNFQNQRPGEEELARLASSVATISTEEQFAEVQKVFEITRRRERTSIPPTNVQKTKFRGRMLSPDDVLNLFAGDITTCCQRFNDVGEGSMLLGSIEENAGIFVIEELDENDNPINIIGQSLTIRQKGVSGGYDRLTFDNIEITDSVKSELSKEDEQEILEIYKQAGKDAIEKDKKFLRKQVQEGKITQDQYDSLVLKEVVAGTGYNDLGELTNQPPAKVVVPDEASNWYHSIHNGYPWIDSVVGTPVILATMAEDELAQIEKRKENNRWKKIVKPKEVPYWYGTVGKVQTLSEEQITGEKINKIKKIERIVFREKQQVLNNDEAETLNDIKFIYEIDNVEVKLGSNEDWYLIYGKSDSEIKIKDLAIVGGINSQKNEVLPNRDIKHAIAEATTEIYKLLLEASQNNQKIYCNATEDTSLINIKKMLQKGLISVKDEDGRQLEYSKEGLVYEKTNEVMEGEKWDNGSEIKMFDLEIIPHKKEIKEALNQSRKWFEKVKQVKAKEKEKGLDELRNKMRKEWNGDEK